MIWYIEDIDELHIYFTDLWREFYVPKFDNSMVVDGDNLIISWQSISNGGKPVRNQIIIDYLDVVDGYGGYVSNPSSALQLKETLNAYIISAWTDITPGLTTVSVDGVTITGDGTPGDPLVGHSAGGANLWGYIAKTTITTGDPTSGHMIWDNATQVSATQLNLSHITDDGFDIDLYFPYIITGDQLIVQDRDDSTNYQIWTVSGTPTIIPNSYIEIPVTLDSSGGTGTTNFANNHDLLVAKFGVSGSTPDLNTVLTQGNTSGGVDVVISAGDDIIITDATASRLAQIGASKEVDSLDTATYPSLTEVSYVKGVTSAIQTQINTKLTDSDAAVGARINASSAATPNDTDLVATSDASVLKKITWTNVKAFLKTYFDTLYQAILVSGTNIKTVNGNSLLGSGDLVISGTGDVVGPASSVASEIVLFDGVTGKLIKRATGTGVVKATSGVYSTANVVESEITLADNTTNNASTSNHGFLKKLDNSATNFMNGQGNWAAPASTPVTGTMVLIHRNETPASGTTNNATAITYTLAGNSYSFIIAEFEVALEGAANADNEVSFAMTWNAGSTKGTYSLRQAATGAGDQFKLLGNYKYAAVFTGGGAITVAVTVVTGSGTWYVRSLRVYGVY